jgi:hypothetical protein
MMIAPEPLEPFAALLLAPTGRANEKTNPAITEPITRTIAMDITRTNFLLIIALSF